MNWYAYKVLADTYDADRRAVADQPHGPSPARQAERAAPSAADLGRPTTAAHGRRQAESVRSGSLVGDRRPAPAPPARAARRTAPADSADALLSAATVVSRTIAPVRSRHGSPAP